MLSIEAIEKFTNQNLFLRSNEPSKLADVRGTLHKSAEHKKPVNHDIARFYELLRSNAGGGTRTHTPLRITDFESVSSANSDTPAFQRY